MKIKFNLIAIVALTFSIFFAISCGKQQTQRKLSGKWDLIKINEYPNQEDCQWQFADPLLIINETDHGVKKTQEFNMQLTKRLKFKIWVGDKTDSSRTFGITMLKKDIMRIEEYEGKVVATTKEFVRANK